MEENRNYISETELVDNTSDNSASNAACAAVGGIAGSLLTLGAIKLYGIVKTKIANKKKKETVVEEVECEVVNESENK